MDIQGRRIWQQAAGDTNRDYSNLCVKWGVILNGPAIYGSWLEKCEDGLRRAKWSEKKITGLRRFCEEMEDGDLVVLRQGTYGVFAVGEIVGCYEHHEEFNDVDGWDLGHVRRVRWLWTKPKEFDTHTLKWGDTTQPLDAPDVKAWLESLNIPDDRRDTPLEKLPCVTKDVSLDAISEYLFENGVASGSISNLMREIGEFVRIAKWYNRVEHKPSESETVNYLVVPLLRALGWTPQRMAIEWNRIDVALFSSLPREEKTLSVVVEAKKMDSSCLTALPQAKAYALKSEHCKRIIVTDGLRYGVVTRDLDETSGKEDFSISAYMNLTRLRREHPIYGNCKGAREALLAMAPEWQSGGKAGATDPPCTGG